MTNPPPSPLQQGLLKRSPNLTRAQFSEHYSKNHAALVAPFFLAIGVRNYVQVHAPLSLIEPSTKLPGIDLEDFDAVALVPPGDLTKIFDSLPEWQKSYYTAIILADERRFLVSEATQHIRVIPQNSVKGVEKTIIRDGECVVEVKEEVWAVWREFELRAEAELGAE